MLGWIMNLVSSLHECFVLMLTIGYYECILLKGAAMIVATLERQQKQDLKEIRKLSKTDHARAVQEAKGRLLSAKIIQADGKLAKPYK